MPWEWVAPVSAAAGTLLTASITTWAVVYTARVGRDHARQVSRDGLEGARRLAHQERVQADRSEAYREALTLVEHYGLWAERLSPAYDTVPPAPDPDPPDDLDQVRVRALLGAHGSPPVQEAFEQAVTAAKGVAMAVGHLRALQRAVETSPRGTESTREPWRELDAARPHMGEARDTLVAVINAELRSPPGDDADLNSATRRNRRLLARAIGGSSADHPPRQRPDK